MHTETARAEAFAAHRRGDLATAERLYSALLKTAPDDAELRHYMGVLCHQTGRTAESADWLRDAHRLAPRSLQTLQLLIRVCCESGDARGAVEALDRYLLQCPDDAGMLSVKGQQLACLGRIHEAEPAFRRAAELDSSAVKFRDLGICRQLMGDRAGAASAFEKAIALGDGQPRTRLWLAQNLRASGRPEYFEAAVAAAAAFSDDIELLIEAQSARRYVCDWDEFERHQPTLLRSLDKVLREDGTQDIPPGVLNYLDVDETCIAAIARRYARGLAAAGATLRLKLPPPPRQANETIRLGYLSTDFFNHAVGSLVQNLFACHDRSRFTVYGYSLRHRPDSVQRRIQEGCDVYRDLSGSGDEDIVRTIQADGIDILVDLAGYTSASRPTVLAAKPAPIQISWLGYLGTSGGTFIDYVIADDLTIPRGAAAEHYTEQIIRLPRFLVASELPAAAQCGSRSDAGLDTRAFVYCSFNQPYKLDRCTFGAWMEILREVPGSLLWLYSPDSERCRRNLTREAERLRVAPGRLVFAERASLDAHVARARFADLALDPFHISGGATSVATLAAGVPILTLRGGSFLARMGSSLNVSLGLGQLDCSTPDEYVEKAISLAVSPAEYAAAKRHLGTTNDLFDTRSFTRHLEAAFQVAWDRHLKSQPPKDIDIRRK